jgi:hypothetical protein
MSVSNIETKRNRSLGYVLIVFALVVLYLSKDIRELGFGGNSDPGPKLFPIGLSILLAIGGAVEIWKNWRMRSETTELPGPTDEGLCERQLRVGGLMGLFLVYILALPYLGFTLSTLVLSTAMMMLLRIRWKMAFLVTAVLTLIGNVLFGALFHVPLPRGVLGLPF